VAELGPSVGRAAQAVRPVNTDLPACLAPTLAHPCEHCGRLWGRNRAGLEQLLQVHQSARQYEAWTCLKCYLREPSPR